MLSRMKWLGIAGRNTARVLTILSFALPVGLVSGADSLSWRVRQNRVDAHIETWDVPTLLGKISAVTGWSVYVEPGTTNPVSAKFKDAPTGEALRLLLGKLNFALVPQRGAPAKLYVFQSSMSRATQVVPAPDKAVSRAIPNERIVTLGPGAKERIEDLARRLGAEIVGQIEGMNAYQLRFPDAESARAAEAALAQTEGARSDFNYAVDRPTELNPLTGSLSQPFPLRPAAAGNSDQVIVGVLDTVVQGQSLPESMSAFLLPGLSVTGLSHTPVDQLSHGTSMAATVLHGLASTTPEGTESTVRILPVDIYGGREETSTFDVALGVYAAINAGATVINMSLAGDGDSGLLRQLIQQGQRQGILFFAAAGNEPVSTPTFPAAYPEVVAVTATDRRGNIAPYANRGAFVDVAAPGRSLVQFNGESFVVTGTSASTAYVSGTAAALRAAGQSPAQVEGAIREVLAVKPPE